MSDSDYYVLWDSNVLTAFEDRESAEEEIQAMGSRGAHGSIADDLEEAVSRLLERIGVAMVARYATATSLPQVIALPPGDQVLLWEGKTPDGRMFQLIPMKGYRLFAIVIYEDLDRHIVPSILLEDLADKIKECGTKEGVLQSEILRLQEENVALVSKLRQIQNVINE